MVLCYNESGDKRIIIFWVVMEAIKMHLTVLPPRLNIATILRPNIGVMAHPVLRQLFYTERNEDSFFCITKTEYELSLVLEDKYLKEVLKFADSNHLKDCIEYWPQNWIALRTDLGSSGAGKCYAYAIYEIVTIINFR